MKKKISLYRFDYEYNEGSWIVHIAAYSPEKALDFLKRRLNGPIKVFSTDAPKPIDIIHDDVVRDILEMNKPEKKGRGRPKGSVTVKKDENKFTKKDVKKDETKNVIL